MVKRIVNGEIVEDDAAPNPAVRRKSQQQQRLSQAHRSVRQAHAISLGMISIILFLWLPLLTFLLGTSWRIPLALLCGVIYQARFGGAWVHGLLPRMLQEGLPPTQQDIDQASPGLFSLDTFSDPVGRATEEYESFLENLAFCCTYGKQNCLTSQMYSGEITLGKIVSLVADKLGQGVLICR